MLIAIAFRPPLRCWQFRLAQGLRAGGHDLLLVETARIRSGAAIRLALTLQQRLLGPRCSLYDRVASNEVKQTFRVIDASRSNSEPADLVIVLDGAKIEAAVSLEPLYNGQTGDLALFAAITGKQAPEVRLQVTRGIGSAVVGTATLAIEDRDTLSRSLDQTLARIVTLVLQGVRRLESDAAPVAAPNTSGDRGAPLLHMARGLSRKVASRLRGDRPRPDHWRVGYRHLGEERRIAGEYAWSTGAFTIVADDEIRFYADPMPFAHNGRDYVFVEDYPYAARKGTIAVIEIRPDGSSTPARTVLERPCHLSYPFLVRHAGEIFMLPETSGAGCVQLFRAAPFPDRWVADRILLDGVVAADATVIVHDGRWWMFATVSDDGGSSWDQLALFHAPDLFGPWVAHPGNPVLVDAGAARPAGAMWHEDGALMRVAQNCHDGYGAGLAICRVDRIDETGFEQTVVARLTPPDGYGADGVHTSGRDGALEVIDLRFSSSNR